MSDETPKSEIESPTVPLVLSLVACFLFVISIIIAGYIHGNMHIEAVYQSLNK
ncbi:hypothetical protein C290910_037 [Synechococcus phage S-CAM1]|uniref:Uncharacterized protein n=1 Tax=Synechococcus phage S-CAM1 TaxID=754037 RepID=A0A1D8KI07_9CAUD|nr:hypothetical protein C290910_037 [Synechococcus phage S-CAM1]